MNQVAVTMQDIKALNYAGKLGQLMFIEVDVDTYQLCGVNRDIETVFILYNTELTEERRYSGTRCLADVARKVGVSNVQTRFIEATKQEKATNKIKLSGGLVLQ